MVTCYIFFFFISYKGQFFPKRINFVLKIIFLSRSHNIMNKIDKTVTIPPFMNWPRSWSRVGRQRTMSRRSGPRWPPVWLPPWYVDSTACWTRPQLHTPPWRTSQRSSGHSPGTCLFQSAKKIKIKISI